MYLPFLCFLVLSQFSLTRSYNPNFISQRMLSRSEKIVFDKHPENLKVTFNWNGHLKMILDYEANEEKVEKAYDFLPLSKSIKEASPERDKSDDCMEIFLTKQEVNNLVEYIQSYDEPYQFLANNCIGMGIDICEKLGPEASDAFEEKVVKKLGPVEKATVNIHKNWAKSPAFIRTVHNIIEKPIDDIIVTLGFMALLTDKLGEE